MKTSLFVDAYPNDFKLILFSFSLNAYRLSMTLTSPYYPKCPVRPLVFKYKRNCTEFSAIDARLCIELL